MLPSSINLGQIDASKLFDHLYSIFHADFVARQTKLNKTIWIDPRSDRLENGKEATFWHLTTKTQQKTVISNGKATTVDERLMDYPRASKMPWIRAIIEKHDDPCISLFYHKETTGKKPVRLYLWVKNNDFVVILQRLGKSSSFLVTSFCVTHEAKKKDYQSRYDSYHNGRIPELNGCQWF